MGVTQAKDLLQAKALGCLDQEEEILFSKLLEEDNNFPWQEFGQYQNLVAFLAALLDVENPDQNVKDDIARKLYEYGEKIKAEEKIDDITETEIQTDNSLKEIEDEGVIIEKEPFTVPEVLLEEQPSEVRPTIKKGISFKEHGVLQVPINERERLKNKTSGEPLNKNERTLTSSLTKKEFEKKSVKSYVSKIPAVIEPEEKSKSNKMVIAAIIISVITLLLLIVIYFKISSDIQENRDEIQQLKEQIHSGILFDQSYNISERV